MKTKTPFGGFGLEVLAVLWNSGGVMDFTMTHSQNEAYLAAFTEEQREYFLSFPLWQTSLGHSGCLVRFWALYRCYSKSLGISPLSCLHCRYVNQL